MNQFFQNIYTALNAGDNHIAIMVVFLVLVLITILLRIITHMHFRTALMLFQADAKKEINTKVDFASLKNSLLRKAVSEYIRTAERAVSLVPASKIAERSVAGMNMFGWKYEAILPLIKSLDIGLLLVGIILALSFTQHAFMYGSLAVIAFLVTRIVAAFFNADGARNQLVDELSLYMEREAGRFFATDTGGTILRLKNDLTQALEKQAAAYKDATTGVANTIAKSLGDVSANMQEATMSIGPAVANAIDEKLINMNDTLKRTLNDWEKALAEAVRLHSSMNESSEKLTHATTKLQNSSELLATQMKAHSNAESDRLGALVDAINSIKAAVSNFATQQEALTTQAKYIERNQHVLSESLHSYEESLQQLTASLGEGLGAFINLHAQTSAQTVNEAFKANIDKLLNIASEVNRRG